MQDPTHRYQLYRGDTLLGTVVHTQDDQPFHIGYIEPAAGFAEVALFFEEMEALMQSADVIQQPQIEQRLAQIRDEIARPGLRMLGESTGQLRFEPQILRLRGREIYWRGHVWHAGQRF